MSSILDVEPSTYDEFASRQCWKDAMMEEYECIMKNDVWEVVSRTKRISIVISKWIFKTRDAAEDSWLEDSPRKREFIMMRHFP
jgi:hypothetical protein